MAVMNILPCLAYFPHAYQMKARRCEPLRHLPPPPPQNNPSLTFSSIAGSMLLKLTQHLLSA